MAISDLRAWAVGLGALTSFAVLAAAVIVWPFVPALLWAAVLTILTAPLFRRIRERWNASLSALATTTLTLLLLGIPLVAVGTVLYVQVGTFVRELVSAAPGGPDGLSLEYLAGQLDRMLQPVTSLVSPDFSLAAWIQENKQAIARSLGAPIGGFARNFLHTIVTLSIAFLTMFFLLRDGERLRAPALELSPLEPARTEAILARLARTVRGVFVGVVLVALIQGALATGAYFLTGVPNAFMWGLLSTLLCMIPLVGAPIVYVPLAIVLFAHDKPANAVWLLVLGFGVVSQVDNLLRPFVIGSRLEMHPVAVFFSLFAGILAMGAIGLFAGPMLLALLLELIADLRERRRTGESPQAA